MSADILNIVIPMAGSGSRFVQAGYDCPKPLIPAHGKPMISQVLDNLRPDRPHRFIFIVQKEHLDHYGLESLLRESAPSSQIVKITKVTEGAACTVLLASEFINNDQPLMIANCDQYVSTRIDRYLSAMGAGRYDGFIMTMTADDPKWSFIKFDEAGGILGVVEKKVVSHEATVGIYNYRHGRDFVLAAKTMIAKNDRVNGEFYVAPVYNYFISTGAKLGYMNIGKENDGMWGLGVPKDLEYFNRLPQIPKTF